MMNRSPAPRMCPNVYVPLMALCLCALTQAGTAPVQNDYGSPAVQVSQEEGSWIIRGTRTRVDLNPATLQMTVRIGDRTWSTVASFAGDLVAEAAGKTYSLRLADAGRRQVSRYETGFKTGVRISLGDFRQESTAVPVRMDLFLCLEGPREELACDVVAQENEARVLECSWPPAIAEDSFDATVVPFMQGMLLPKTWPEKVWLYDTMCYGRGLY
ncbi:MAG: hypothetical protein ABFE01_07370, partial [Phycisphaerales bacterium]